MLILIVALVILALIVVPIPFAWLIGKLFPNGYTQAHTRRISEVIHKEWKRVLLCAVVIWVASVFWPGNVLQVSLIAIAILLGRFIAVGWGR